MKLISFSVLATTLLASIFSYAGSISDLKKAYCENSAGSYVKMSVADNVIHAQLQELPYLAGEFAEVSEKLDVIKWVPGKLHGFGGMVGSEDGRITNGLVTFLYNAADENQLPETSEMRVHYADTYGMTSQEVMNCKLEF